MFKIGMFFVAILTTVPCLGQGIGGDSCDVINFKYRYIMDYYNQRLRDLEEAKNRLEYNRGISQNCDSITTNCSSLQNNVMQSTTMYLTARANAFIEYQTDRGNVRRLVRQDNSNGCNLGLQTMKPPRKYMD
jgi:hypothetical protein